MSPFQGKLRIRHLEAVLAIADFGSLSKAAGKLHLTASGLSRVMTEVEEIVGGRLFERTSKGMLRTPLGEALCRHAQVLLGELDKAETDLAAVANGSLGSLTVGCFSLFSAWPLADAVRQFQALHPRVALAIQVGMHEQLVEALDGGSIDLLIGRRPPTLNPAIYRATDLLEDGVVLACGRSHPLAAQPAATLRDSLDFPWVAPPARNRVRIELETRLRELGAPLPTFVGVLSLEFSMDMILDGRHICMLPSSVAQTLARRRSLHILPVALELSTQPLAAIWRHERTSTRQIRDFTSVLNAVITSANAQPL